MSQQSTNLTEIVMSINARNSETLNKRGLEALQKIVNISSSSASSGKSISSPRLDLNETNILRSVESRNQAILNYLNFMIIKTLIAITSLAGNALYINNIVITNASLISIFQMTLFIFFTYIDKIESLNFNQITEISALLERVRITGGGVENYNNVVSKIIKILKNAKSIQHRDAIIYLFALFACIFMCVFLKENIKKGKRISSMQPIRKNNK